MRDPFSWSLFLFRMFGVNVRVHITFLVLTVGMGLWTATNRNLPDGATAGYLVLVGLVFVSVLIHEFGHCFAARSVEGDATEILMWPLGGLAYCDIPKNARAHFITAAGGPLVNIFLCLVTASILYGMGFSPPWNPFTINGPYIPELWNWREEVSYFNNFPKMYGDAAGRLLPYWLVLVAQLFYVNYALALLNLLLLGFPLDGGRLLQAALWPRMGYRRSMIVAITVGFIAMFVVGIFALMVSEVILVFLAGFIYFSCRQELVALEMGAEDSFLGYDFSQGYTSLERGNADEPEETAVKKKPNFVKRWMQRRAEKKAQKQKDRAREEEERVDFLLQKIQEEGRGSLSEEENRFLKRVSDRLRKKS